LYRFLLSLYGDGRWNAPPAEGETQLEAPSRVHVGAEGVFPLAGKPAKGEGKIRAVLKSVANSQEAPAPGPLTAGIDRDAWVIVASDGDRIDPQRCADLLKAKGIISRVIGRSLGVTVEVRAQHVSAASELVVSQRSKLKLRPRRNESILAKRPRIAKNSRPAAPGLTLGLIMGPQVALAVIAMLYAAWPSSADPPAAGTLLGFALASCALSVEIGVLWDAVRARIQREANPKSP
jgi:hypothetical protein